MKNYLCKWIPPRDDFLSTLAPAEMKLMQQHAENFNNLLEQGFIITHGPVNNDIQN
ncbi:hypothetical protein [Erwinia persicina]|uniref:hypothetical protein n=1 Tax=Erwinia persicina TaxID=55211 RepID=UPI001F02940E|nr:hypothetical protein [Erwinia persicina]